MNIFKKMILIDCECEVCSHKERFLRWGEVPCECPECGSLDEWVIVTQKELKPEIM